MGLKQEGRQISERDALLEATALASERLRSKGNPNDLKANLKIVGDAWRTSIVKNGADHPKTRRLHSEYRSLQGFD